MLWRTQTVVTLLFSTGIFPETHYPRLLQTVSRLCLVFVFLILLFRLKWNSHDDETELEFGSSGDKVFVVVLSPKSFWRTLVFWPHFWHVSQTICSSKRGKRNQRNERNICWYPPMKFCISSCLFSVAWQDWRSVRSVHTAHWCWVLGHVDRFTLQRRKPSSGQVCCLCAHFLFPRYRSSLFTHSPSLSKYSAVYQPAIETQRALGGRARFHLRPTWVHGCIRHPSVHVKKIRGWLLCWPNTFLRCINPVDSCRGPARAKLLTLWEADSYSICDPMLTRVGVGGRCVCVHATSLVVIAH